MAFACCDVVSLQMWPHPHVGMQHSSKKQGGEAPPAQNDAAAVVSVV